MSGEIAIRTADLEVAYGRIRALQGVNIEVKQGTITALVGANGAGKSTLLKSIAGLVPSRRGRVEVPAGVDITRVPPHERVRRLGLVLVPEGRGVFGGMTVEENLALGTRVAEARRKATGARAVSSTDEIYQLFPILFERRKLQARYLSGGEQQMLGLGRALLMEPSILLIDEPSMGLAPLVVKSIFKTLHDVLNQKGITVLLVEQDSNLALAVAEYAYAISHGTIELSGPAQDMAMDPRLRAAYLGA
jgi:branched-chain amino acid transport system ATP-binding protein